MKNCFQLGLLIFWLSFSHSVFAQQPNIILYIIDDVGVDPFPNYLPNEGAEKASLPHIESLMEAGITFDNTWSNPVCAPSRSCILTGKYGFRTNVLDATTLSQLSTEETTLHDYLDESSSGTYSSSLIGKWHLSGGGNQNDNYPAECGIPYYAGNLKGAVMDYYDWDLTINGQTDPTTEYLTPKYTDLAIDWINNQDQPWFCWVAHNAAHTPFHVPPAYMHSQGNLPADQTSIGDNPLPYFLAMIESLDYELGRLMDNISEDVLANTVIIIVGDNGTQKNVLQSPYSPNQGKGTLFQGGINVPMVIAGPGVTRNNEREPALINFTDLFSTIVEITGTNLPEIHDSKSFYSLLSEPGTSIRDCVYNESVDMNNTQGGWTLRNDTYKLIRFNNGNERFYNLIDDPYENSNLMMGGLTAAEQMEYDDLLDCHPQNTTSTGDISNDFSFEIFPNPVYSELIVELDIKENQSYQITDLTGISVKSGVLSTGQNRIQVDAFPAGLFFITVGKEVRKFVKQ
jgi:arylsulfatase A-like enzyme